MKKINLATSYHFYFLSLLLLFIDICTLSFFEQYNISILLCFYAVILMGQTNIQRIIFVLVLLSCESLLLYGTFGLSLLYLLPLSILMLEAKNVLNKTIALPYIFWGASIIVQELLIKTYIPTTARFFPFTLLKICASIILLIIFNKILSQRSSR